MDIFSSQQKLMRYRSYKGKKDYWTDLYYCLLISLVLRKPKENRKEYGCVSRGPYLFVLNTELDFHLSQHRLLGALPEHLWRMSTACLKMVCGQGGQSPLLQAPGNGNRLSGSCSHSIQHRASQAISFPSYCRTKAITTVLLSFQVIKTNFSLTAMATDSLC